MPGESEKIAGKVPVQCSHCGFTQLESAFAKSTFCRKCSKHFDIRLAGEAEHAAVASGSIFRKLGNLLGGEKTKVIHCFDCGAKHQVSSSAQSSLCGHCGAYIDLRDFKITAAFSRNIQTAGIIVVTRKGDLTSTKLGCGEAIIQGNVHGNLFCSGVARVKLKGRLFGSIETNKLVIEKGSEVEFIRPVKCDHAEIHGKVSARITAAHVVAISKTGSLEGTVYAKSITVEKGGIFHGELFIGKTELSQVELLPGDLGKISPPSLAFGQ